MMDIPWYIISLVIVVCALFGILIHQRLTSGSREATFDTEDFEDLFKRLQRAVGLNSPEELSQFGTDVHRLRGTTLDELELKLEGYVNSHPPFCRVTIRYPNLQQTLEISGINHSSIRHWLPQLYRTSVGEEHFDNRFNISSQYPDRTRLLLSHGVRYQLKQLHNIVEKIVITDRSVFLFLDTLTTTQRLNRAVRKGLDIADRLRRTSKSLGPVEDIPDIREYERGNIPGSNRPNKEEAVNPQDIRKQPTTASSS